MAKQTRRKSPKKKFRRVMNEVDKRPASTYQTEEFIIANSGRRQIKEVEVGGKRIELFSSGATTYDPVLAGELKDKYKNVELMLVEGVPHSKVKELYAHADLAVDQLLIGWYGGFAVEMMALGKPVVCYIRKEDLKFIPDQMRDDLPIVNANPDTIYEVLSRVAEQRDQLHLTGERGRAYVERWHDPLKIALKTKEVYESIR